MKLGLTFFIRTHTGLTQHLRGRTTVSVLIGSSYGHSLLHDQQAELDRSPRLVCVAGGVGITAILPIPARHGGNRTLYRGFRKRALLEAAQDMLDSHAWTGVQWHVAVGQRLNLQYIRTEEVGRAKRDEEKLAVVVSGPPSMADDVNRTVARFSRDCKRAEAVFVEESYGW